MKRKYLWTGLVVCLSLAVIWACFLRDPIMPGERNAEHLAREDKMRSEQVQKSMPESLQLSIKENLLPTYGEHLIFLKVDEAYYAMVDANGTLLKLEEDSARITEVFSLHQYTCGITVENGNLHFLTGVRESREKRNLTARFIHGSKIAVLTDVKSWEFDFSEDKPKEVS